MNPSTNDDFWDWLPRAYRDGDKGDDAKFTKWNMEVAYTAGRDTAVATEKLALIAFVQSEWLKWDKRWVANRTPQDHLDAFNASQVTP